jgi:autotransporter-associated beta strand protein
VRKPKKTSKKIMKSTSNTRPPLHIPLLLCALLAAPGAFGQATSTWNGSSGSTATTGWNSAGNWTPSGVPWVSGSVTNALVFPAGISGAALDNGNDMTGATISSLTISPGAGSYVLGGNPVDTVSGIFDDSTSLQTLNLGLILSAASNNLYAPAGGDLVVNGVIGDGGNGYGIAVNGAGLVSLTTNETFTGTTFVNAGTLELDFNTLANNTAGPLQQSNNIIAPSALSLGGGTLLVNGSGTLTNSQTFTKTTVAVGSSVVQVTPASGTVTISNTLALGALTNAVGATVMFVGPATSTGATSTTGQSGSLGNASTTGFVPATANITTTTGTANLQITGPTNVPAGLTADVAYATVGLYDFATVVGTSPFTIVGSSQAPSPGYGDGGSGVSVGTDGGYALINAGQMGGGSGGGGGPYDIVTSAAGRNTDLLNGIRFNQNAAVSVTGSGVYSYGGVLVTPNVGENNITMVGFGILRATNGPGSLAIWQNNTQGFLNITGALTDNSEWSSSHLVADAGGAYIQAGPGTVNYEGANTYNGPTFLNGGTSMIQSDSGFGAPTNVAQLVTLNGGTVVGNATFTLDNGSGVNARPFALGINGGGLAAVAGKTMTVDGVISGPAGTGPLFIGIGPSSANGNVSGLVPGSGPSTANSTPVYATGLVVLSGANTWTGGTVIDSGTLNFGPTSLGPGGIIFNGGGLQWATGNTLDVSSQTVTILAGVNTLDLNGNNVTLANSIGNSGAGSLIVTNGTLTLDGANTYSGGTTIGNSASLIAANTSGSATGSGPVTVLNLATLGGTGTIAGSVTWQSGALASFTQGSTLTISGAVTLNGNSVKVNVPGVVPLGVGTYTLMTYNNTGSTGAFSTAAPTYSGAGVAPSTKSSISTSGGQVTLTVTSTGGLNGVWDAGASGNWSTAGDWLNGLVPGSNAGDVATFGVGNPSTPTIVSLTQNETLGEILMTNANAFQIANASGNSWALKMNNTTNAPTIVVTAGTANAIQTAVAVTNAMAVTVAANALLSVSGNITNADPANLSVGTLAVSGPGTLALSGNNSFGPSTSGQRGTALSAGSTLQVGSAGVLGAGDLDIVGTTGSGKLQAGASSVALPNNIDIAVGLTATVDSQANALTLSGTVEDSGGLTKIGSGSLALSGSNTYTGQTAINAGVVRISADANLGSTTAETAVLLNGGDLMGTGAITLGATRNINIGLSAGLLGTNALIDAAAGGTFTIPGIIGSAGNAGADNLIVNSQPGSTGTVELEGANTYTGTTVVSNGTLMVGAAAALATTTVNYNNQGGTLAFDGSLGITAPTLGGLSGSQSLPLLNTSGAAITLTFDNPGSGTVIYSGVLSDNNGANGAGNLVQAGANTQALAGANTYTGTTTVNSGILLITNGGVISNASAINIAENASAQLVVASGGTVTTSASCNLGEPSLGILVTAGGVANFNGGLTMDVNDYGADSDSLLQINTGGVLNSTTLTMGRNGVTTFTTANGIPTTGSTVAGLYVNGGTANFSGEINVGNGQASSAFLTVANGGILNLTNGGTLVIGDTTGRYCVVDVVNGTLLVPDTDTGISLGNTVASDAVLLLRGGTIEAGVIGFGQAANAETNVLTMTNGDLYLGSGGLATVSSATSGNLNLVTFSGGLLGALTNWTGTVPITVSNTPIFQTADPNGVPQTITLAGGISGTGNIIITGGGTLILNGTNNWTGWTTVSNGATLALTASTAPVVTTLTSPTITVSNNATFDVSALSSFTLTGQTLQGSGTNNGSIILGSGSSLYAGLNGTYGTNTFNNNLTLGAGVAAYFDLGTVHNQANDLILVNGSLTLSGNPIHIKAPSAGATLDTSADYVLFSAPGGITGSPLSTPVWDVQPANYANFSILANSSQVVLHYYNASSLPPTGGGSISPSILYQGQSGLVTVTVTPGGSSFIKSVVLSLGALGGTTTNLILSSTANVWTNTIIIPNNNLSGAYSLTATIVDGNNESGVAAIPLTVLPGKIWTGGGTPTPNWSDSANWLGLFTPSLAGDSVIFAGTVNRSPLMDNTYNPLVGVTFYTNAAAFTLNAGSGDTLNLSGGVTNNSPATQTLVLPIVLAAPVTFSALSNNLVFLAGSADNVIDTGSSPGFLLTVADGGYNTIISNNITDGGSFTKTGPGTNTLYGQNTYTGNTIISAGTVVVPTNGILYNGSIGGTTISNGATLTVGPGGLLSSSAYTSTMANNGTFNYFGGMNSSGLSQTFSGVISGAGAINIAGGGTNNGNIVVLDALNTFTGNVTISNTLVSVQIADNNANPTSSGLGTTQSTNSIILSNNAWLSFDSTGANELGSGGSTPTLAIVIGQGAVLQITDGNSVLGPLTLNGGTLIPNAGVSLEYMAFELARSPVTVGGTSPSFITNTTGSAFSGLNLGVAETAGNTTFNVASTGSPGPDLTVEVPLADAGGETTSSTGLIKTGAGRMLLTGQNVYHGSTTISNGILALGYNTALALDGSISNSPNIIVTSNGTLNVTALTGIPGTLSIQPGQTLSGNGAIVGSINAPAGSYISPGTSASTGALTISGALTEAGGVYNEVVLTNNANPNVIQVAGNLNASGLNYILVSQLGGGEIPPGTNVLITYGGSLIGSLANFNVAVNGTIPVTATLTNITSVTPNEIAVVIGAALPPTNLVWVGDNSLNNWDSSSLNWTTGTTKFAFESGDSVVFTDTGSANPPVNLALPLYPASVVVSNSVEHYTFTGVGSIAGTIGLRKTNTGTLTILNDNTYTGQTVVGAGALEITNINGSGPSPLGGAAASATNLLFYNGATFMYSGSANSTLAYGITNVGGIKINVTNPAVTFTESGVISGTGPLISTGPGTLAFSGANTYIGGTEIEDGGTNLLASNDANSDGSISAFGPTTNPVTFYGGSTLQLYGYGQTNSTSFNAFYNPLVVPAGQSGTVLMFPRTGSSPGMMSGLTGGGTLTVVANFVRSWMGGDWSQFTGLIIVTNLNTGQTANLADAFEIDNTNGYAKATFWLQGVTVMDYAYGANGTINIGALSGDPGTVIGSGNETSANPNYTVGWLNTTTNVFAGTIMDPTTNTGPLAGYATSITKVGTGTWYLGGTNTYTGNTIISNGTLALTNVLGIANGGGDASIADSTNIFINTNAVLDLSGLGTPTLALVTGETLGGGGTVKGAVDTTGGGTISLGIGATNTLSVTNSVAVGGPILVSFDHTLAAGATSGTLKANSLTVNSGSTLVVSQGTNDLVTGDTFTVFKIATGNPIFTSGNLAVTLPTTGPVSGITYVWNTANLAVNGTIKLVTGGSPPVNKLPPEMLFSGSPTTGITIGWPTNLGWRLVYQSNSVGAGLSTNINNWVTWPNSTTVTQVVIPIGATNEVFFQLIYP